MSIPSLETRLKKEGIIRFNRDMRLLATEEIQEAFGSQRSKRIVLKKLMKSIIWQVYERLESGEEEPFIGNLRTFWYQFAKPVLSDLPIKTRTDPYAMMTHSFQEMVMTDKFFQYSDFELTDDNWENRRIGETKPNVLVFTEKVGWFRLLRRWHERWGISVLALGGFPSALTSEYTSNAIKPLLARQELQTIGIVDYDPSGFHIASSFINQLRSCGLKVSSPNLLIDPKHYAPEEIKMFSFPLPKGQKKRTENWLQRTGGLNGEARGLESESMHYRRIESMLEEILR